MPTRIAVMSSSALALPRLWRASLPLLLIGVIVVVFLPLTRSFDLDVFLRAGYALIHGQNVYPSPGSPAVYSGSSFVYPYFAAWPFVALATLPPGLGTMMFFVLSACAVLAACLIAAKGDPWPATLTLCTAFTVTGLQLGALSPLLFVGVVFLWRLRDKPLAFALLAAPVVASKLFLAPLLVWTLLARRYRTFAYASASTVALLALSFALGPIGPAQYLNVLSQLGAHEAQSGYGLIGALMNAHLTQAAAQAIAFVVAFAVFAAAYVHVRRTHDERLYFCAGIVASLVLTPVLWSHYFVLLSAALLTLGAPRRWFVVLALVSWAIAAPHGVHLDTDLIEGVASSGTWLVLGVGISVFALARVRARASGERTPRLLRRLPSWWERQRAPR
jgi:alpha-1,2-mannosyltransferase